MIRIKCRIIISAIICLVLFTPLTASSDVGLWVKGSYFHYSEPGAGISYAGLMSGIQGDFEKAFSACTVKFRSEYMMGRLTYDGHLNSHQVVEGSVSPLNSSGTAIQYGADMRYSDSAVLVSRTHTVGGYLVHPGIGLGYRHLDNPENAHIPYDYSREVSYVYLPIVVGMEKKASGNQAWGLTAEVDVLLRGTAKAHLSDASANYNDLSFSQKLGGGVKLSGFYNSRLWGMGISIQPFVDIWMVDESDTDVLTYEGTRVMVRSADGNYGDYCEPANITTTAGLQFNISF